ncbi:hypothetical protein PAB09_00680 [Corynebacterium sp. SCR221107]|uniref:hypothetical protein n=1 Tax=Corynebacterium sp. SCR221107 TaxID=3017361 RepID=UPI0022EC245D|nr:hypothetical protein [Corynebacterium sp. SCR221107]WBT08910.1 hypothetical protein PAB09_00680 [Corynebacterium sp. SCR221107]
MFDQLPQIAENVQQFVNNQVPQPWQQLQQFNPVEHVQQWAANFHAPAKDLPVATSSIG